MANGTGTLAALAKKACSDETAARELFEKLRWPNGAACPRCGGAEPYRIKVSASGKNPARQGLWKCRACRKPFTVTVGTVFEASHVPLSKWLMAIHLMSASKKGISAHQLHRMLGVTYRAAWFVNHRLRWAMATKASLFSGVVEVDETYIGGKRRVGRYAYEKGKTPVGRPGPKDTTKTPVVALVERGGRAKAFPMPEINFTNLRQTLVEHTDIANTHLMTDELGLYPKAAVDLKMKRHEMIRHMDKKYVRGDVHTNTVEGFFSLLKRGIVGSFHHVSKGHLHRYCSEFAFRYSTRSGLGYNDGQRAELILQGAEGKRLTFKQPSGTRAA